MVTHMKTTIEISDGLMAEVKEVARERGEPMRSVIEAALRRELDTYRDEQACPKPFVLSVFTGDGLQPGVDPHRLLDFAYDDWRPPPDRASRP